jgi:hypothetical protein
MDLMTVGGGYDAVGFNNVYPYQWNAPVTTKKVVTETMEYDEKGNIVKRTVVTEETTTTPQQPYITWNTANGYGYVSDNGSFFSGPKN